MSEPIRAELVPYSSVVGQSISLQGMDGRVFAQLAVMAPAGPPPGESHQARHLAYRDQLVLFAAKVRMVHSYAHPMACRSGVSTAATSRS